MEDKNLTDYQIEEIRTIQNSRKCTWEEAYEIWNEDTARFEDGE